VNNCLAFIGNSTDPVPCDDIGDATSNNAIDGICDVAIQQSFTVSNKNPLLSAVVTSGIVIEHFKPFANARSFDPKCCAGVGRIVVTGNAVNTPGGTFRLQGRKFKTNVCDCPNITYAVGAKISLRGSGRQDELTNAEETACSIVS
jgi:hypothetical protein